MFIFLTFLFHLFLAPTLGVTSINVDASPRNIIGSVNMSFTVTISNPVISSTSTIAVTYPSDFVQTDGSNFFCYFIPPSANLSAATCFKTGNSIVFYGGGSYDPKQIVFKFGNFTHTGSSNITQNFQFFISGNVDPYTIYQQVPLVPFDTPCIVFSSYAYLFF